MRVTGRRGPAGGGVMDHAPTALTPHTVQPERGHTQEACEDAQKQGRGPHLATAWRLPRGPGGRGAPQHQAQSVEASNPAQLPHGPEGHEKFGLGCHADPCTPTTTGQYAQFACRNEMSVAQAGARPEPIVRHNAVGELRDRLYSTVHTRRARGAVGRCLAEPAQGLVSGATRAAPLLEGLWRRRRAGSECGRPRRARFGGWHRGPGSIFCGLWPQLPPYPACHRTSDRPLGGLTDLHKSIGRLRTGCGAWSRTICPHAHRRPRSPDFPTGRPATPFRLVFVPSRRQTGAPRSLSSRTSTRRTSPDHRPHGRFESWEGAVLHADWPLGPMVCAVLPAVKPTAPVAPRLSGRSGECRPNRSRRGSVGSCRPGCWRRR